MIWTVAFIECSSNVLIENVSKNRCVPISDVKMSIHTKAPIQVQQHQVSVGETQAEKRQTLH
jgi:hypothetical protein